MPLSPRLSCRGLAAGRGGLFLLAPQRVGGHDIGLRDGEVPAGGYGRFDLAALDASDEFDEILPVGEDVEAHFLDPVGGRRSQQPLEVAVLGFHRLDRGRGPVPGQGAEEEEMLAGDDLGLELGVGLLPPARPAASIFWSRSFGASLATWLRRTCSGDAAYDSIVALESIPASSFAPSFTHCSILAMASSLSPRLLPARRRHPGLLFALDPLNQVAVVRLPGLDDLLLGRSLHQLGERRHLELAFSQTGAALGVAADAVGQRIGAMSVENLIPVVADFGDSPSDVLLGASSFAPSAAFLDLAAFSPEPVAPLVVRRPFFDAAPLDLGRGLRPGVSPSSPGAWFWPGTSCTSCPAGSCSNGSCARAAAHRTRAIREESARPPRGRRCSANATAGSSP